MTTQHRRLPKIIFFDIDDTLYIKDQHCIPASVKPALMSLKQRGVLLAIATGRSLGIFPDAIKELVDEVKIDYLITLNGQYTQYQGKKLFDYPLEDEQIHQILAYFRTKNIATACMSKDQVYALSVNDNLRTALGSLGIEYRLVNRDDICFAQPIYQILAFYRDCELDATPSLPATIKTTRWHDCAVDVLDRTSSKARAIKQLLASLAIDAQDTAAFGDHLNDLEMFELVGTAIAMDNGHPAAKQAADIICPRHDENGIAKILHSLGWLRPESTFVTK